MAVSSALGRRSEWGVAGARGTKGGRPRDLPVPITSEQRAVLEWAKTFAATAPESMIPRGWRVERWRERYRWLCRRLGCTRRGLGVTPHSLRHGVLLDFYQKLTGVAAPVRGGTLRHDDPAADQAARELVAIFAGHGRAGVASIYLGRVSPAPQCNAERTATAPEGRADGSAESMDSEGDQDATQTTNGVST
jgi:hypothetical protein